TPQQLSTHTTATVYPHHSNRLPTPQQPPNNHSNQLGWVSDVRGSSLNSQGNQIKTSCSFVAFCTDQAGGGMVGLCSVDPGPDGKWAVSYTPCHDDQVTDLDFSPFDDLLATCSSDQTVKLWRVGESGQEVLATAEATLKPDDGRLELVLFHPTASGLLAVASSKGVQVWDTSRDKALAGTIRILMFYKGCLVMPPLNYS
uniref:Coronin n=1 Tax=Astyanax mexicanus TaxID=7994 RepID=A0A3B1JL51_ASTMX